MKRASLILSLLASMFALACGVDQSGNMNASNDNKNIGSNSNARGPAQGITAGGVTAADPGVITIPVVVCYDANRTVQVRVAEPLYVSAKNQQKVRWCVYNDLDVSIASVSISAFNSGSANALLCSNTPNLTTGAIPPGNLDAVCTEFCAAVGSPSGTSFQYTVTARPDNQNEVNALGPRVIIQ